MKYSIRTLAQLVLVPLTLEFACAAIYNPAIGEPDCQIASSATVDLSQLDCTTAYNLKGCNYMCTCEKVGCNWASKSSYMI